MKPFDFFDAELRKSQDRFNQTFGVMTVCNLKMRYSVILAIAQMGILQKQISSAHNKDHVRPEIKQFVRARDVLKGVFDEAEEIVNEQQKRRRYVQEKKNADEAGNGRRISGNLRSMRQCVSG